jgi:hypothetical protein
LIHTGTPAMNISDVAASAPIPNLLLSPIKDLSDVVQR